MQPPPLRLLSKPQTRGCTDSVYCPDGGGQDPFGGTKDGDKWAPMADAPNRWVQVGTWGSDATNTCLGHHQVAGGQFGDP